MCPMLVDLLRCYHEWRVVPDAGRRHSCRVHREMVVYNGWFWSWSDDPRDLAACYEQEKGRPTDADR